MDRLKALAIFLKKRKDRKWDNTIIIDGQEGSGKSTLGLLLKGFYDGKLNLSHIVYDGKDLLEEMETAPDGSCIMVDEGKDAAFKRLWYSDLNIALAQALAIVRDKNYLLIVNVPRFKQLDGEIRDRFHYRFWAYTPNRLDRGYANFYEFVESPFPKANKWQRFRFHYRFPPLPDWFEKQYHPFKRENLDRKMKEYRERVEAKDKKEKRLTKSEIAKDLIDKNPKISDTKLAKEVGITLTYAQQIIRANK